MQPLINEAKKQVDENEKNAKLSNTLIFFGIYFRMKYLNRFVYSFKASPRELKLSILCCTSTKNVKCDKNQELNFFISVSKTGKSTKSLKTLDCVTPIPLERIL